MYQSRPTVAINHMHTHLQYCTFLSCSWTVTAALEHCTDSNFTFLLAELIAGCWYKIPLNLGRETDGVFCCLQPQWHRLQCALSLWHWSEQGSVSEAPGVRYSNTTGSQWLCPYLKSWRQYMGAWFQSNRHCMCASWEAGTKESITVAVNQKEQERGGGKQYFQLLQEDRGNTCKTFFGNSLTSRLVTTNPTQWKDSTACQGLQRN